MAAALDELRARALFLKVLGCYPSKARPVEAHLPGIDRRQPAPATGSARRPRPPTPAPPPPARAQPAGAPRRRTTGWPTAPPAAEDTLVRVGNLLIGGEGFVVMAGPGVGRVRGADPGDRPVRADQGAHVLRGASSPRTARRLRGLG